MLLGALEAGGTKMICSLGDEQGHLLDRARFDTRSPEETMPELIRYFSGKGIAALGIGSFGPLDLNSQSPTFGYITTTPKEKWQNFPLKKAFEDALHVPVALDTDVNAAMLAEQRLGAAQAVSTCLYVTVGTGIGGGVMVNGQLVHGLIHPELGHMLLIPAKDDPTPQGFCPFHVSCAEGLASGTAINKRWGVKAEDLPLSHPAWQLEADYLAQLCMNALAVFAPEKIILGGGVMQKSGLIELVREKLTQLAGGYWQHEMLEEKLNEYLVLPGLNGNSGAVGALLLAADSINRAKA